MVLQFFYFLPSTTRQQGVSKNTARRLFSEKPPAFRSRPNSSPRCQPHRCRRLLLLLTTLTVLSNKNHSGIKTVATATAEFTECSQNHNTYLADEHGSSQQRESSAAECDFAREDGSSCSTGRDIRNIALASSLNDESSSQEESSSSVSSSSASLGSHEGSGSGSGSATGDLSFKELEALDDSVKIWWVLFQTLTAAVCYGGTIMSALVCLAIYFRSDVFPFNMISSHILIAIEIFIPIALFGSAQNTFPDLPCWIQLIGWNVSLFPIATYIIFAAVRLRLDYNYSISILDPRRLTNRVALFGVRHYRHLTSRWVVWPVAAVLWAVGWISIIPRSIRVIDYWGSPQNSDECTDETDSDLILDMVNTVIFGAILVVSVPLLMSRLRDAFRLKECLASAGVVIVAGTIISDMFSILSDQAAEVEDHPLAFKMSLLCDFSYVLCLHIYTWAVPFRLLRFSVTLSLDVKAQRQRSNTLGRASVRSQREATDFPVALNTKELKDILFGNDSELTQAYRDAFSRYLVTEFCVENMKFLAALNDFSKLMSEEERQVTAQCMLESFVFEEAVMEVNISQALRYSMLNKARQNIAVAATVEFWREIEMETLVMLLPSWQRFIVLCRKKTLMLTSTSAVHPIKRTAPPL